MSRKEEKIKSSNVKSLDLAGFIVNDLKKYARQESEHKIDLTFKYLNPTYAIRITPVNGGDTDLCHTLGYTAAHCVQAGYTNFSVGLIRNYPVMIPVELLTNQLNRMLKRSDPDWQRLVSFTGQPNFLSKENMAIYLQKEKEREI